MIKIVLSSCFFVPYSATEQLPPFSREIQPEELWLYKFQPVKRDHVPTRLMFVSAYDSLFCYKGIESDIRMHHARLWDDFFDVICDLFPLSDLFK